VREFHKKAPVNGTDLDMAQRRHKVRLSAQS